MLNKKYRTMIYKVIQCKYTRLFVSKVGQSIIFKNIRQQLQCVKNKINSINSNRNVLKTK